MTTTPPTELRVVDARSAGAQWAMRRYFAELEDRFPQGFDSQAALTEAAWALNPPYGAFVVADVEGAAGDMPIACGAVRFLDAERAEIKRMWVSPDRRGLGLASVTLRFLEDLISDSGRNIAVLDSNSTLVDAIALYRHRGYLPIDRYNDNPDADVWLAKTLTPG